MSNSSDASDATEVPLLRHAVATLRTGLLSIVGGVLCGTGLMVATLWLVARGGDDVGAHLGLLSYYFPGYEVSGVGSLIGFFWGAFTGALLGAVFGWVYNRVAKLRERE